MTRMLYLGLRHESDKERVCNLFILFFLNKKEKHLIIKKKTPTYMYMKY